jgi:hypothetical protein
MERTAAVFLLAGDRQVVLRGELAHGGVRRRARGHPTTGARLATSQRITVPQHPAHAPAASRRSRRYASPSWPSTATTT